MTAAGTYTLTQVDTNSGFPRGSAYLISDNGVVAGVVNSDELEKAFVWTATNDLLGGGFEV